MNLLFIRSIEGRILMGITMFVGMMILVGWVAINEEARMQAFVQQHTGPVDRSAAGELFALNLFRVSWRRGIWRGRSRAGLEQSAFLRL